MTGKGRRARTTPLWLLWLGYFTLAGVSIFASRHDNGIAAIWLANAFAIAFAVTRMPGRDATTIGVVATAGFAANVACGLSPVISAFLSIFNAAEVGLALMLTRFWLGRRFRRPRTPEQFLTFLILSAVGAPVIVALVAAPSLALLAGWPARASFHQWLAGDLLGVAIVAPPMLLWRARERLRRTPRQTRAIGLTVAAAGLIVTWGALILYPYPLLAIGIFLLMAGTVLGRREIAMLASFCGSVAIAMALAGLVPGLESGAAAFAGRFQPSLAFALVLPVFVSVLVWRMRTDKRLLAQSEEIFRRAMEDSAIGMAIVELDGRIRKANGEFCAMLDYSASEIEGKTFYELTYPDDRSLGRTTMEEVRAGTRRTYRFEKRYLRRDGTPVWAKLSGSVICDHDTGKPRFLVSQIESIDERKKAEEAVAEAENRWSFALSSARQGVWDLDLRRGRSYYSDMWREMLGYRADELGDDPGLWLELIHPEDRQRAVDLDSAHQEGRKPYFEAEFRMRHKDGSWVWVLDRGKVIERDEDGRVLRAIGTHTDITAQKQAQQRLAETAAALEAEKERLRVTLHSIGDAVICTDAANLVTFMNAAAEALTGRSADDAMGRPLAEVYCPRDEDSGEAIPIAADAAGRAARAHSRAVLFHPDGSRSAIRQIVSPIATSRRSQDGLVIVFQDFTDARTLQRQLAHAASHDSLTGLANRASFMATIRSLFEEARDDEAVCHQLLFVDLDRFKTVNDTAGHMAGDALLKQIADTLRKVVRRTDFVGRLGGDEFALILKHCGVEEAASEARKIIDAVNAVAFSWNGQRFSVGASIGIAPISGASATIDEIIANADKGCYLAKSAGRGAVSVQASKAA